MTSKGAPLGNGTSGTTQSTAVRSPSGSSSSSRRNDGRARQAHGSELNIVCA